MTVSCISTARGVKVSTAGVRAEGMTVGVTDTVETLGLSFSAVFCGWTRLLRWKRAITAV